MFSVDNKPILSDSGPFDYGNEISLTIRRLDLTDPVTGGNKWFKLWYNLKRFKEGKYTQIVTFGGAFSNHIAAVAKAGKHSGIQTTGIIRGEPESGQNITLSRAKADGMNLIYVSRGDYRKKDSAPFLKNLLPDYNNCFILPEGGSNSEGVIGCARILDEKDELYTHIAVACGTGATAAGLILSLKKHQQLIGFSVLRDGGFLEQTISDHLNNLRNENQSGVWHIEHDFHFGGYAKSTPELNRFVKEFSHKTGVPIEPVYTGKLFFGLEQLIKSEQIPPGSKILAIHTGGLQYLLPA